jgi:2-C-methyl-D-erythritol 2,4-cyclodiphosphate synthase
MLKVGMGYDVHRLVDDRKLLLGGVEISHGKGLLGHSDGDVLIHAVIDAVLGAFNLGDIGTHFPDTDPRYDGMSSLDLLVKIRKAIDKKGRIEHIDSIVVVEAPRIAPHIPSMKQHISHALGIHPENVSVKAKTAEGVGEVGRELAIEAFAIATVDV